MVHSLSTHKKVTLKRRPYVLCLCTLTYFLRPRCGSQLKYSLADKTDKFNTVIRIDLL